jgi:hypothetical protein
VSLVEEIKIPFAGKGEYRQAKSLYFNRTIAYVLSELFFSLMIFLDVLLQNAGRSLKHVRTWNDFLWWLSVMGVIGFLICGRQLIRSFRLYTFYRDIAGDVEGIARALLQALVRAKAITTPPSDLSVRAAVDKTGAVFCHLEGGTTFEKSLFIKSLQEIIDPVDSPRYLMIRRSRLFSVISRNDYHSVPELIGRTKALSEYFEQKWQELAGSCELVFTRTVEGRKVLLKARLHSLAAQFQPRSERVNKWR